MLCAQAQELDDEEDDDSEEEEMVEVGIEEGDDAGPIEGAWGTEEYIQDDSTLEVRSRALHLSVREVLACSASLWSDAHS